MLITLPTRLQVSTYVPGDSRPSAAAEGKPSCHCPATGKPNLSPPTRLPPPPPPPPPPQPPQPQPPPSSSSRRCALHCTCRRVRHVDSPRVLRLPRQWYAVAVTSTACFVLRGRAPLRPVAREAHGIWPPPARPTAYSKYQCSRLFLLPKVHSTTAPSSYRHHKSAPGQLRVRDPCTLILPPRPLRSLRVRCPHVYSFLSWGHCPSLAYFHQPLRCCPFGAQADVCNERGILESRFCYVAYPNALTPSPKSLCNPRLCVFFCPCSALVPFAMSAP
ncbi:hypothetical protein IWX49DRAFT_363138 [Phyllosticta citricarpa]